MKWCYQPPPLPPTSGFLVFLKTLTAVWCKIQGWAFRACVHLGLDLLLFGLGSFLFDFRWLILLGKPPGTDGALVCSLIQGKLFRSSYIIPFYVSLYPVEVPNCAVFRWRKRISEGKGIIVWDLPKGSNGSHSCSVGEMTEGVNLWFISSSWPKARERHFTEGTGIA